MSKAAIIDAVRRLDLDATKRLLAAKPSLASVTDRRGRPLPLPSHRTAITDLPMANEREAMLAALHAVLVPELRARGFRGRMPHFRRLLAERIDLLTIQFDKYGGGFVAEIAKCAPEGVRHADGSWIVPERVTTHDLTRRRRLGATAEDGDHWFRYDGLLDRFRGGQRLTRCAQAVASLVDQQAEVWWRDG